MEQNQNPQLAQPHMHSQECSFEYLMGRTREQKETSECGRHGKPCESLSPGEEAP